jgi:uncharacterized membrane protein YvbJ
MYCKYCGAQLTEGANFCTVCGKEQGETVAQAPAISEEERSSMRKNILGWGITSLAFASSFVLSFLGFIFAIVAKAKAKKYYKTFGVLDWQAKVGNLLANAGLGVGIGLSRIWFFYIIIIFILAIFGQTFANGTYEIMNDFTSTSLWIF